MQAVGSRRGWAATLAAALLLVGGLGLGHAFAMGGTDGQGGDGADAAGGDAPATTPAAPADTTSNVSTAPAKKCPSGWTLNADSGKCEQESSGLIEELPAIGWQGADPAFLEAAVLAHSGKYAEAIGALEALGRPDDPYVLNYLGYSHRKLGEVSQALAYYHRALALRPDYVRVHEYLGEGYLELGRLDDARGELKAIAVQCGSGCDPYVKLDAAIAAHLAAQDS